MSFKTSQDRSGAGGKDFGQAISDNGRAARILNLGNGAVEGVTGEL